LSLSRFTKSFTHSHIVHFPHPVCFVALLGIDELSNAELGEMFSRSRSVYHITIPLALAAFRSPER